MGGFVPHVWQKTGAIAGIDDDLVDRMNELRDGLVAVKSTFRDVRDYGAKGDGVNDDAPAIQAALDACGAAGGGTVFLPPGTYKLLSGLTTGTTPGSHIVIQGSGVRNTQLSVPVDLGAGNFALNLSSANGENSVRDLHLKGPNENPALGAQVMQCYGIRILAQSTLRDVKITGGFLAGIYMRGDHSRFTNVLSGSGNYYGVYWPTQTEQNTAGNNMFQSCRFTGCAYASFGIKATGRCDGNTYLETHLGYSPYGVYFESGGTGSKMLDNRCLGLNFEEIGNAAIYDASGSTNTELKGNTFTPSGAGLITYSATRKLAAEPIRDGLIEVAQITQNDFDFGNLDSLPLFDRFGTVSLIRSPTASNTNRIQPYAQLWTKALTLAKPIWSGATSRTNVMVERHGGDARARQYPVGATTITVRQIVHLNTSGQAVPADGTRRQVVGRAAETITNGTAFVQHEGEGSLVADSAVTIGDLLTVTGVGTAGRVKTKAADTDIIVGIALATQGTPGSIFSALIMPQLAAS